MEILLIIVLPICLAVSFLCAGMEAGVFELSRWRIAQQMRAGQARAARLYAYLQNTENFLWTILVGNVIAMFFAMGIVAIALMHALAGHPVLFWLSFFAASFVFYTICDLLPKTLFRQFSNRLCLLASTPFRLLDVILAPVVAPVESITNLLLRWTGGRVFKGHVFNNRNELRSLIEDPAHALTSEERGMISRVFDLHNITLRQITIPFSRWPILEIGAPLGDALTRFSNLPQNILPVWSMQGRQQRVAGFLDLKRVIFEPGLQRSAPIEESMVPAFYLDEDLRAHDALRRMQRAGQRLAVVVSKDRREIGLVTLESILRAIFGEMKL